MWEGFVLNSNMTNLKILLFGGVSALLGVFLSFTTVHACHPWINAHKYTLSENSTVRFHIAYGHKYPFGHSFYNNDKIENMYVLSPEGERSEVVPRKLGDGQVSQVQYASKKKLMQGTYMLAMESKANFGARTSEGYERKPKTELKGKEIKGHVSYSQNFCKAIVNAGGKSAGNGYKKVIGHGLEIVPLNDPSGLRTGDFLPVKILHNGKDIKESVMIYATYMGFSTEPDVFAYTVRASFKKEGIAQIKILHPGIWMIFVNHKYPYPDTTLADDYNYQSTLTFEVK